MPIREFQCETCHHKWEVLNPQGQQQCPKCKSSKVKQVFSTCNWNWGGLFLYLKEEGLD